MSWTGILSSEMPVLYLCVGAGQMNGKTGGGERDYLLWIENLGDFLGAA